VNALHWYAPKATDTNRLHGARCDNAAHLRSANPQNSCRFLDGEKQLVQLWV
jgi:hypothetical protein